MYGWTGKILRIDLTSKRADCERPGEEVYHRWIGGKGLAGYFLHDHCTRRWNDPLMPLIVCTGPLVDTPSPTSGRCTFMSRSPLTGTVGDASVGGAFGTELKRAGWDGVIITGCSNSLCGIEIDDSRVTFVDAAETRGMTISEMTARLLPDGGKGSCAVVGPAADNGVYYSNIMVDGRHTAGRNGLGLVMHSKGCRYIRVRGNGKTAIADKKALRSNVDDVNRLIDASPALMGRFGIAQWGTAALYDLMDARRMMPTGNFRKTYFPHARHSNAFAFHRAYHPVSYGCRGCHIRCKKGTAAGTPLPEFESLSHFSALLENRDIKKTYAANLFCNEMGMDTISAAVTIACSCEIDERKPSSMDILRLLEQTVQGREDGRLIALGSARLSQERGAPDTAMTVKDQELPAYDPRGACGMALGYVTSTRGGCHLRAYPIAHEILRKPVATDRFSFEGKARINKITEDINAVVDSLTACKFVFFAATLEEYAPILSAVSGVMVTAQDLMKCGERIDYNERMMNAANGFSCDHDDLPRRFFAESGTGSVAYEIPPLDRDAFLEARSSYYVIRGLDQRGRPMREKACTMGLEWND